MRAMIYRCLSRSVWSLFVGLFAVMPIPTFAESQPTDPTRPVAYIEKTIPPNKRVGDIAKMERNGREVPIEKNGSLLPGDRIVITMPGGIVIVRQLATNEIVAVGTDAVGRSYPVPKPALPGLPGPIGAWLAGVLRGADQAGEGSAMAASRAVGGSCYNETGETNRPTEFRIPILVASRSNITSGNRAIFVSWQGGAPPFSLTLSTIETGKTIAQAVDIRGGCAAYLPQTDLRPGRYRLTLTDSHGVKEQEDSLYVVDEAPAEPRELRDADLPEDARRIYAATWMVAQDRGTWAFEAQQRVAAMDCRSAAVQDWLRKWGSPIPCNETNR